MKNREAPSPRTQVVNICPPSPAVIAERERWKMKITKAWLEKMGACPDSLVEFNAHPKKWSVDGISAVKKLIKLKKLNWANWLITRLLTHEQQIKYAIYAAEQVIEIYEKKYPDDKRPRNVIDAAKKYLAEPSDGNKHAVAYAADAAIAADAANAAYAAAIAAASAAYAAYAATSAAASAAAYAAAAAAGAANAAKKTKIIKYGIELLRGGK